jgi:hypothetical protein
LEIQEAMEEIGYMFKHEKQNAYLLALKFISWKTRLYEECTEPQNITNELFELLDKGGLSILFYTLEGNEKKSIEGKPTFYSKAIMATKESSSCLDALVANGLFDKTRVFTGKKILVGIAALLEDRKLRLKVLMEKKY